MSWPPGLRDRLERVAILLAVLAVLAATGWWLARQLTAPQHSGPGTSASGTPSRWVSPVSAAAFGPAGLGDGDNARLAALALDGNPATAWHSDWYTTAFFGNLQPGTGLLLDLGRPVTVVRVDISLGSTSGADLQVRAGPAPTLLRMRPVAQHTNAGGVLHLRIARPAAARYLLIWFTRLPRDAAGTYQASIQQIRLAS